jgi:hypothetical protein
MTTPHAGLDQIVAQLGRDLSELRTTHDEDTRNCRESIGLLAEIMPRLGQVETDLAEEVLPGLSEVVSAVAELTRVDAKFRQVHWPSLTAEEAPGQWRLLVDWAEEILAGWYRLTRAQLPDCWALHRPVVVELSWLRIGYLAAYSPKAAPHLAAEWNTRWRRDVLTNIAAAISTDWCRPGEHLLDTTTARKRAEARRSQAYDARVEAAGLRGKPQHHWDETDHARFNATHPEPDPLQEQYRHEPESEPTRRGYWESFLHPAIEQDVAWRAERDATRKRARPSPVPRTL